MSKYHIKCNFKEKLVEIDICRFFGAYLPILGYPYYLEDTNEQITGSDLKSFESNVIPIYMQVKISEGLRTISKVPASTRKNRSPLEDIRIFRDSLELDLNDDYFMFFPLRRKAATAEDFQHNVLMKYANTGFSHAFYIAPLSITKIEYERILFDQNNFDLCNPFYYNHYDLRDKNWSSRFGFIPFLRNHISIIPHEPIDTHKHYYAYSKDGIDVTWHSPEFTNNKPSRLSDTLIKIINEYYKSEEKMSVKQFSQRLLEMPIMKNAKLDSDNPIDIINFHGKLLEEKYSIKQVVFVMEKNDNYS